MSSFNPASVSATSIALASFNYCLADTKSVASNFFYFVIALSISSIPFAIVTLSSILPRTSSLGATLGKLLLYFRKVAISFSGLLNKNSISFFGTFPSPYDRLIIYIYSSIFPNY